MNLRSNFTATLVGIFISFISFGQTNKTVMDHLNVPGPIVLNKNAYNLTWSSHPSPNYYKQEYLGAKEKVERYNKMVIVEVLIGDAKPIDLATTKMNELKQLKQTNPIVNYDVFQKNGEVLLDFLLSENTADGKINILERNVYRYKAFSDKNGNKGVMLFAASERSYGNEADSFLVNLKKNKSILLNAVAAFVIPELSIKK